MHPTKIKLYLWQLRFQGSVITAWYCFIVSFWNLFWTTESALVTRSRTGWPTDKHCIYSDRLCSESHDAKIEITVGQNVTFPVWWTGTIALEEPASILKVRKRKQYYGLKPSWWLSLIKSCWAVNCTQMRLATIFWRFSLYAVAPVGPMLESQKHTYSEHKFSIQLRHLWCQPWWLR
jgi:hypothetical protein